ncbi:hypothetical protein KTN05_03325 [Paracoccus sp. Z118]|uniref:anti-sigma factor family protein n=1 Tax=Paracoccus sp. Z118 TaxID=2851017 RepID=UPI001C2B96B5|nr:hypothetical protein [Paracoccus sp. Z118]MBV0890878.1 hypothetical protein [Paracoccus sp. Z118]
MQITDEILMAFADGELDAHDSRDVAAAIEADPQLQARLRMFSETRRLLGEEAAAPQPAHDDAALIARIRSAARAPATASEPAPAPPRMSAPVAANLNRRPLAMIAAALAAAVVGLSWWQFGGPAGDMAGAELAALDGLASGESRELPNGQSLVMIASYVTGGDEFCREYETRSAAAATLVVACREDGGWTQRFAMDMTEAEGYAPTSGGIEALDAFLVTSGAGEPLTPEEEAALLAALP